jgi:hypothetical protein
MRMRGGRLRSSEDGAENDGKGMLERGGIG